VKSSVIKEITL